MSNSGVVFSGLVLLAWIASGPPLYAQASRAEQQVPPMPSLWNESRGSWLEFGLGYTGFMVGLGREFARTTATLHLGYDWTDAFRGADAGLTIGLPLSRGRPFAALGGGLGCLSGVFDSVRPARTVLCLDGDFQVFARITPRIAIGLYATMAVNTVKTAGGVFLCLQYGRWEI